MLKLLAHLHEFSHGLSLEFLDVLVLLLKLAVRVVLKSAQLERLGGSLVVDLLLQVVLRVVDLLHYVLLALNASLHLAIELILQAYNQNRTVIKFIRSSITYD